MAEGDPFFTNGGTIYLKTMWKKTEYETENTHRLHKGLVYESVTSYGIVYMIY